MTPRDLWPLLIGGFWLLVLSVCVRLAVTAYRQAKLREALDSTSRDRCYVCGGNPDVVYPAVVNNGFQPVCADCSELLKGAA